jgi:type II secretory pathway component PulF
LTGYRSPFTVQYAYTAKSRTGETTQGVLAADSPQQVRQVLRQQGLFALSVAEAPGGRRGGAERRRGRVAPRELMAVTSQWAIMTRAGIDVAGALESLARQCPSASLRATLHDVHREVMEGKAVSAALRNHIGVFGNAYVASVAAGEASGQLPQVLDRLAKMQRCELRLRSTRRALMAYPIVLSSVSGLVILGLMFFVLPQFAGVFAQFDVALPAITQFLLWVSGELRFRWWLWAALIAGAAAGFKAFRASDYGRRWWDHMLLHAAMIRHVSRNLLTGRAFRLLGIMIDSGVPLIEGLRLTQSSIQNVLFRDLFDRLQADVLNGRGLADALAAAPFLPNGAVEMISTAERTGSLGMVTQVMGDYYEEEGETKLRELATLVEPIVIVVMGLVVACIVLAVMLPMFDFATMAQHGG